MQGSPSTIDIHLDSPCGRPGFEHPLCSIPIADRLAQPPKKLRHSTMPENGLSKAQPERHFVGKCLQCADPAIGLREANMRPCPIIPVPEAAIVSLHSNPKRISAKNPLSNTNFAAEDSIRMGSTREPDPSLVAHGDRIVRTIAKVPGNGLPPSLDPPMAAIIIQSIGANFKREGLGGSGEFDLGYWKLLNECLRPFVPRKPCRPNLRRSATRQSHASIARGVGQQVANPPGTSSVRKPEAEKP